MNSINVIYLRVSKKEEKAQDLESQKYAVINKFKPEDPLILQERGSAFNLENIKNREEFLKLLDLAFDSSNITIKDLFLQNFKKKSINIYIWDYNRIMRNLQFNLLFSLLCMLYEVKVYSYKDNSRISIEKDDPDSKLLSILFDLLAAKRAEDYSRDISINTKKSFKRRLNSTYSIKNNKKVGRRFTNKEGSSVSLTGKEEDDMYQEICRLIKWCEDNHMKQYYSTIMTKVEKQFKGVYLSAAFISKIKTKLLKGDEDRS